MSKGLPPFIVKTYHLLSEPSYDKFIQWNEDGNSFTVLNPSDFATEILPKHFKHKNFCSFVRQLNIYGFHKVDPEKWIFKHENDYFTRDDKSKLNLIKRKKKIKRKSSDPIEPVQKVKEPKLETIPINQPQVSQIVNEVENPIILNNELHKLKYYIDNLSNEFTSFKKIYNNQNETILWLMQELNQTRNEVLELKNARYYPFSSSDVRVQNGININQNIPNIHNIPNISNISNLPNIHNEENFEDKRYESNLNRIPDDLEKRNVLEGDNRFQGFGFFM